MDISPLGVVLEPSNFIISFLTISSVTILKRKRLISPEHLSNFAYTEVIFNFLYDILYILVAIGI